MGFKNITAKEITGNIFEMIGDRWMLITAGDREKLNTMTANWGSAGILWGMPVAFCFVRPTRFTYGIIDSKDFYTLSFYGEEYRKQLSFCGTESGRNVDKVKEAGFTTMFSDCGAPYFAEAELVLVCRKLYADDFDPKKFIDASINGQYEGNDYHRMYIGEITEVLEKE